MNQEEVRKFWLAHEQAKAALHKEQSSPAKRKKIQQRLAADVKTLKNAQIVV